MGFLVSTWPIGCDTPSPFSQRSFLGEHAKWRYDTPPPPPKGYLSNTCAIPYKTRQNACDTPLCDTISKGYCAIWRGISHWATKLAARSCRGFFSLGDGAGYPQLEAPDDGWGNGTGAVFRGVLRRRAEYGFGEHGFKHNSTLEALPCDRKSLHCSNSLS